MTTQIALTDEIIPLTHHQKSTKTGNYHYNSTAISINDNVNSFLESKQISDSSIHNSITILTSSITSTEKKDNDKLRSIAISLSLYANIAITLIKLYTYIRTSSLSVLATLVDSILDICSQGILAYTEYQSNQIQRSSELFPSGASRVEPIGVLICSALMGMASFEVIKESFTQLYAPHGELLLDIQDMSSFWQMLFIVFIKLLLMNLCQAAMKQQSSATTKDATMEALKLDHLNDCLSNAVAAVALLAALSHESLVFLDPVGAISISIYIIYSWYNTGREQITHLSGIAAPPKFIKDVCSAVQTFDSNIDIDWCRAYHFGPKYLVELEIILPSQTILKESHDLGMKLQYHIESMEEVERCFVHIDYESRPYDEHVVSKIPGILKLC